MCRSWRRLALQLLASLSIKLCALHEEGLDLDEEQAAAAIERLLPHLTARNIATLRISGCTAALAPVVPVQLAQLVITHGRIPPSSLEAFRRLPGLTALHLPNCELEGLPDGLYLSRLERCVR